MILPLELLCQAILFYETFKALKAPPPPRKRRNANTTTSVDENGNAPAVPRQTAYAANKRKRAMKVMLRAWIVYASMIPLEKILDYTIGWILPFYSSIRTLAVLTFIAYHKTAGDIGYSHFLMPFLKPREPSLDWVFAWLNEILDVGCYIATLVTRQVIDLLYLALLPVRKGAARITSLLHATKATLQRVTAPNTTEADEGDTTMQAVPTANGSTKTPRRSKRSSKPRYSEIATPYVPGHLVADESVYPPVQPRLRPAERSIDDVSAFQEAMDRAQAAFYEASSSVDGFDGHAENSSMNGRRRKSRRTTEREDDPFLSSTSNTAVEQVKQKTRVRKTVHLPTFQEQPDQKEPSSPQAVDTIRPSANSLGKRREVSEEAYEASAEPEVQERSPEKIKKVGSFEASRHSSKQNDVDALPARKGTKSRPARPKTQAASKLPTRQATRTEVGGSAKRIAITESGHLAREAAIRAYREQRTA